MWQINIILKSQNDKATLLSKKQYQEESQSIEEMSESQGRIQKIAHAKTQIYLEPELTDSFNEPTLNLHLRHHHILRPMQSVMVSNKSKEKKKTSFSNFLLESRRKQICNPTKKEKSSAQKSRTKRQSESQNMQIFDLSFRRLHSHKQTKRIDRLPISIRNKQINLFDYRTFQMKVRGWQTDIEEFVDFD